tara:strand:+ start:469 stop:1884 length:1416 start_codon:yes stop_codon:yes gene_type:complete
MANNLWKLSAKSVRDLLQKSEISPIEAINSAIERISQVNKILNAVPVLCIDRAKESAKKLKDKRINNSKDFLFGLPILIKDLTEVEGVKTTYGSPIYKNNISKYSNYLVENLEKNGAIVLGKTNTPEFGAGSHTFNEVFGTTLNPWNQNYSCGGSSGGSAVALASGMSWLSTGTDLGGSLRNPAGWCGVVGMRNTAGLVAHGPRNHPKDTLSISGPMARNTEDLALMLDAMKGLDTRDPISISPSGPSFKSAIGTKPCVKKVAWTKNFNFLPCDDQVSNILNELITKVNSLGFETYNESPDLNDSEQIFQILRANLFAIEKKDLLEKHRKDLKPEIIWNIEKGLKLSKKDVTNAELARTALALRVKKFFNKYDILIAPSSMVPPFEKDIRWVKSVGKHHFDNYVSWLMTAAAISVSGCPSLALTAGFTKEGLPVGIQIIGKPYSDWNIIAFSNLIEKTLQIHNKIPLELNL